MLGNYLLLLLLLATAMWASVRAQKLTIAGAMVGGLIGFCIYQGAGFWGIGMIGLFFILGSLATSWKMNLKEKEGAAEKNKGRRKASQVLANGGIAGLLGLLIWLFPEQTTVLRIMMAASLASATADTLSSELGTVYGSRFYNILTLKKDQRGLDGVISAEGTLIGIAGSALIALVYAWGFEWSESFWWIIVAGTIGNLSDSILGAALERRHYLQNDAVNLLNTLIGALAAWLLYLVF